MPPVPGSPPFDTIARRWHALAQRRLDYFPELYRSGRWRHYYTEERLAERILDVIRAVKLWAELAQAGSNGHDSGHDSGQDRTRPAA
jgi:uncharacterized repeat protein (TIGR03809 family)